MKVNIALDSTVHLFNQHTSVKKKEPSYLLLLSKMAYYIYYEWAMNISTDTL